MDWRTWHFSWMQRAHLIEKGDPPQVSLLHSFPPWMTLIGQTLMCSQVHTALCISSYLRCQWWRCADYHWRVTDGSRQTDRRRIKGRKGVLSHLLLLGVARNCQWFSAGRVVVFVVKHHVLNSSEKKIFRSASITMTWSPCVCVGDEERAVSDFHSVLPCRAPSDIMRPCGPSGLSVL